MPDGSASHNVHSDTEKTTHGNDNRAAHLESIETALRRDNPDLPNLHLIAQSHYGPPDRIAFVEVHGVSEDRDRRRQIRAEASDLLGRLGYQVEIEPGRDVYDILPEAPVSAHDAVGMLQKLRDACRPPGAED